MLGVKLRRLLPLGPAIVVGGDGDENFVANQATNSPTRIAPGIAKRAAR